MFEEGKYVVEGLSPLISGYSIILLDSDTLSWKGNTLGRLVKETGKKVYSPTPSLEGRVYDIRGQLLALAKLQLRSLRHSQGFRRQRKQVLSILTEKSATFSFFFLELFGINDRELVLVPHC